MDLATYYIFPSYHLRIDGRIFHTNKRKTITVIHQYENRFKLLVVLTVIVSDRQEIAFLLLLLLYCL